VAYNDSSLEARFLRGDLEAVAAVIRWITTVLASPRFWSLRPDWLDLHQEAMRRVIESLRQERFDASQNLRTYVQGVARYTAMQALTAQLHSPAAQALEDLFPVRGPGAEESLHSRQLVRRVLSQASDGCRDLLLAYFYEQRSYAEISAALGVPVGTVKSRLVRCLEKAHRAIRPHRPTGRPSRSTDPPA
jgi:RNA polymerase sigma factor (sigma-70 family)